MLQRTQGKSVASQLSRIKRARLFVEGLNQGVQKARLRCQNISPTDVPINTFPTIHFAKQINNLFKEAQGSHHV
jgi:hypothetical protein